MELSTDKVIEELNELIRYDYDAVGAYDAAIAGIHELAARDPLIQFRADHERHIVELSAIVRRLGATPVDKPDFKGVARKTMTKVAGIGGTELILKAMQSNERVLVKAYMHHQSLDFPADIAQLVHANFLDEERHLAWVESALHTRIWETGVSIHP
jgi:Domain of unknown function (DUF2383)